MKANKEYEMATNTENTNTIGAGSQAPNGHTWADTDVETRSPPPPPRGAQSDNEDNHSAARPSFGQHGAVPVDIDPDAQVLAEAFYARYKSACHGITRRIELNRLYDDTFDSWVPHENGTSQRPVDFSKVLFAMVHHMRVLRVVDGGRQLVWKVFNKRPHQGRDEHPERRDQHPERRDQHHERRDQHHEHPERRERREYHERRAHHQEHHQERREHHGQRFNLANIVSNQQKMIDALMSKVMKSE